MPRDLIMLGCRLILFGIGLTSTASAGAGAREIARREFGAGSLRLLVNESGMGQLLFTPDKGEERPVVQ